MPIVPWSAQPQAAPVTGANSGNAHYLTYNGVTGFGGTFYASGTISTTNGSSTVQVLSPADTTGLVVGQSITATGIPVATTIASIVDSTHITISNNATATGTATNLKVTNLLADNIRTGAYTCWGYEHMQWKTSLAGAQLAIANTLKTQIHDVDFFSSGLEDNTAMTVTRSADGGTVTTKY